MEFYNPVSELDWLYGKWTGSLISEEEELNASLTIQQIGSLVVEFDMKIIKGKSQTNFEKCILVYDRTLEICKSITSNHEGYIEFSEVTIKNRNKHTELISNFNSGINLPPNMKIQKKWTFHKDPKQLKFEVKMGKDNKIVASADMKFSTSL